MKCPYSANRYLDTSKLPSYMTPLLGTTEAVRAEPFSMSKTGVRQPNFCKPFNKTNAVGKVKRSSKVMVTGLSTSRRENIKYHKEMRASLAGADSTHGGGKTSYRDSQRIFGDKIDCLLLGAPTHKLKLINIENHELFPIFGVAPMCAASSWKNEIIPTTTKPTPRGAVCLPNPGMSTFLKTVSMQEEVTRMSPIFRKIIECLQIRAPTRKQKLINIENHNIFPTFGFALWSNVSESKNEKVPIIRKPTTRGAVSFRDSGMINVIKKVSLQQQVTRMSPIFEKIIECLSVGAPTRKLLHVNIENHQLFPTFGVALMSGA